MNSENGSKQSQQRQNADADFAKIEQLLTQSLDESLDNIDVVTTAKLSAARHRALASGNRSTSWNQPTLWKSGFAALSVCVLVVTLWSNDSQQPAEATNTASSQTGLLTDLDILASTDGVEFYESLDFLLWLENAPENSG